MNGEYPINDTLINHISIKFRRNGKRSLAINLSRMQILELKLQGNKFVQTFDEKPNSIIVGGRVCAQME
jgi:hypothetical protein